MSDETRRLVLSTKLKTILGNEEAVYFQPPSNIELSIPRIVYSRSNMQAKNANNKKYKRSVSYTIIFISKSPNSIIVEKLYEIDGCAFDRHYVAQGLNHDVFTISI